MINIYILSFIVVLVAVFNCMILLGLNTLPEGVKFTKFYVTPNKYFKKGLGENELLNNAERLFENEIKGPEGFEVLDGELYTTTVGGYVVKIYNDKIIPVVKFGQPCESSEQSKCGRPLGIKAFGKDELIIADAYYGIFKYNIRTKQVTTLVDKNAVIDGKNAMVFNSVEVGKDGSIYWVHSSSHFSLDDLIYLFLADGSGRLVKYDPVTQENTVLLDNLYLTNGLVLSPDEDFLLVSESGHSRVLKFYLKGSKKFKSEIFIDGLPGMPDNMRVNGKKGFFIPLVIPRNEKTPSFFQRMAQHPHLRKFMASSLHLVQTATIKPFALHLNLLVKAIAPPFGSLDNLMLVFSAMATVLEVDLNGNIIQSYHGSDGSVTSVSDVIVHNDYMYFGSPVNNYIGRVKLSKLRSNNSRVE